MKPFKMFGLAALAALMAMAFVGASSAMANGSTALCAEDEAECGVTHVHEETLSGTKAKLLNSVLNVECEVLFLGDALGGGEGNPLVIHGNFTYSSCNGNCTATEENGPAEIKVLKEGHELATVTGEGLVHLVCSGFINCRYNGTGLNGHGLGPLLSSEENGSVTLSEQTTSKESGTFCPSTAKLDITTTPLEPTYIGSAAEGPSELPTSLTTSLKGGGKEGAEITVTEGSKVKDTATLSGENASKATGTVKYAVYKDKECKELVTKAGEVTVKEGKVPDSEEKELEAGAIYYWQAEYGGDSLHEASTSVCSKEILTVKAKVTLSTTLSGGGKEGAEITVAEGSKVKDTATLSGTNASSATGTVDYAVYKDKECKELATEAGKGKVEGTKVAGSEEKELEAGAVYYWQAEYLGDSLHEESTSTCSKEVLTVKAKTTLATKLVGGGKEGEEITVAEGSKVKDTATLSGTKSSTATGTVKYKVYKDKECKELVTSAGEVSVTGGSVPNSEEKELEAGAVYYWQAEYGGDSLHEASTSVCSKEVESIVAKTSLTTLLLGEVSPGEAPNEGEEIIVAANSMVVDQATISGSNASSATGTATYRVYSNETCKKLFAEAGEVTVEGKDVPASDEVAFPEGTYYWQVEYSGDSLHEPSTSTCTEEVVTVRGATSIKTLLSGGEAEEGEEVITVGAGVPVTDSATLSGVNASKATGTVKYFVYSDEKCKELVAEAGEVTVKGESVPASEEESFEQGVYYWQAVYSGDSKNYQSTSPCGSEIVIVNPTITTTLSGGGQSAVEISAVEGTGVTDSAKLWSKHAAEATGTVKYFVYSDDKCKELVAEAGEVSVTGAAVPPSKEEKLAAGTYFWQAVYSGDGKNPAATSTCGVEVLIVDTPTSVTTTLSGGEEEGEEIVVDEDTPVSDQATLSGKNASKAKGSVAYRVYSDSECTELAALAGDVSVSEGSVPSSNEVTLPHGTYYWQAEYSGDELNNSAISACGSEIEVVTALITTSLSGGEQSGEVIEVPEETPVTDTATLHTKYAAEATGTVKYFVYSDEKCKELVTAAGEVSVAGASVPKSSEEEFEVGTYYWQAVYSGDEKNPKATSRCGIEKEIVVPSEGDQYAALGDSFSSGEGVRFPESPPGKLPRGEYYKATDIAAAKKKHTENRCHRSPQAWPAIIAEELYGSGSIAENKVLKKQPDHFIFRACSGAKTINLWREGEEKVAAVGGLYDELLTPPTEWRAKPAQDLWLGLPGGASPITGDNEQITAVTVTVGASDAGFAEVAQACSQNPGFFKRYSAIPCQETIEEEEEEFPSISEELPVVLQHMRGVAPMAHIWIPLYPRLLDMSLASIPVQRGRSVNNAAPGLEGLTAAQSLERYLGRLNRTIEETVLEADPVGARINVIQDTVNAFDNADGQHLLGDAEPWLDGIFIGVANKMESFHPDRCGHIEMARVVAPFVSKEATLPKAC